MSGKQLLFIHGCSAKPDADELHALWRDALLVGLRRDREDVAEQFAGTPSQLIHFADLVQEFVKPEYDPKLDVVNRRHALDQLARLRKPRDFRRRNYDTLPGKTARKEFAVDAAASVGLGSLVARFQLPELHAYLHGADWGRQVRNQVVAWLQDKLTAGTDVLLMAHCLGSVIAYDALWTLSRELQVSARVTNLVTLGSPLSDNTVRAHLQGASLSTTERYPNNIVNWQNISAEDDYVCHDKSVADDFAAMLKARLVSGINDHTIYNLAIRYGKSNPHSSVGYLVHPRTTSILAEWLTSASTG